MRIKICGIKTKEDLDAAITADADAVGFLVGQIHSSKDFILPSTAGRLAGQLSPYISPVIVTHLTEAKSIMDILVKAGINTVQLHGGNSVDDIRKLRDLMPLNGKIIFTASVGERCEPDLEDYYPYLDAVLLDTCDKQTGQVGGTGKTHNWDISAAIVKDCHVPVILAGGLTPDNVVEAIATVNPFGVDANSGLKNDDGGRCPEKCRAFVENAKSYTFPEK